MAGRHLNCPHNQSQSGQRRIVAVVVCIAFTLTGAAIALFAVIDFLLPRHLKQACA
jgi:hypothetical protein